MHATSPFSAVLENTEAQTNLHRELVGTSHKEIIEIAKEHHVLGWKKRRGRSRRIYYTTEWPRARCPALDAASDWIYEFQTIAKFRFGLALSDYVFGVPPHTAH